MKKSQYRFNPESVSFEKVTRNYWKKIGKSLAFFVTATIVGFATYSIVFHYISSPNERKLKEENQMLQSNYKKLEKKMGTLATVLEDIQNRDDNLYRFLLNAEPLPSELRNSGIGGVNRYEHLSELPNATIAKNTAKKLDDLLKKTYIQTKSLDELEVLANDREKMLTSVPAIMPVKKELLKSPPSGYGMRLHPIYKIYKMHNGIDFSVPAGTEIYATGDGVVTKAKRERGYGNIVVIKHNYGDYETRYAHMLRMVKKVGQKVKRGDVIGFVGNTGISTAPHLHYEVRKNGRVMNPINYYFGDLTPEEYEKIIHDTDSTVQSFD